MTWNDLITQAYVDMGVIQPGDTLDPASSYIVDGQARLNELLGSLSTEGLMAFQQISQQFPLQPNTDAYTVGVGGTLNTAARAQKITAWRAMYGTVLRSGGPVLSLAEFGAAAQTSVGEQSAIPKLVGADTSYPLINLRVGPPPSSTPGVLELDYFTPITQVTNFTAPITGVPDGWPDMLHFNLAVRMYPIYARSTGIPPELAAQAQNSKASIVSQNQTGAAPQQKEQ